MAKYHTVAFFDGEYGEGIRVSRAQWDGSDIIDAFVDSIEDGRNPSHGLLAVSDEDWRFIYRAFSWGVETAAPKEDLGLVWNYGGRTRIAKPIKSGLFRFVSGREKLAANHLRDHVKDALLEIPRIAFAHWHHRTNQLASYRSEHLTHSKVKPLLDTYVRQHVGQSIDLSRKAATAAIEFEFELDGKFREAGDSFAKTLAVCEEYIDGDFGWDWFCDGYFDVFRYRNEGISLSPMNDVDSLQNKTIDNLEDEAQRRRYGASSTHFKPQDLAKVFRRFPALASVYHHDLGSN